MPALSMCRWKSGPMPRLTRGTPLFWCEKTVRPTTRARSKAWAPKIKNVKSGLVLSVVDASVQAGAKTVQRPAQGMNPGNDQWLPVKNEDGTYSFFNHNSRQALDNPGANIAAGTQFTQWFANDSLAQKFALIPG